MPSKNKTKRVRVEIAGVVQGVGFRPFVFAAAAGFGISGFVGNETKGVFIEAEGDSVDSFIEHLRQNTPPLAHISTIRTTEIEPLFETGFRIIESEAHDAEFTLISPDIAVCDDCLREMRDPADRRYQYPFINCTNCGPRFTITRTVPYDRPNTTMDRFEMCAACRAEYEDPLDRRFHAQPISCWECGPSLILDFGLPILDLTNEIRHSRMSQLENLKSKIENLKSGRIVAVKGIGGFHLACDARNSDAVEELRRRKGRGDKPFAVMCRDLETAKRIAYVSDSDAALLESRERPIVLIPSIPGALPESIAPGNRFVGIMLPYAPLHYLLFDTGPDVLVMTSGNLSNEPIVKDNDEAFEKLANLADAFLLHDRDIFVQCDDSVVGILDFGFRILDLKPDLSDRQQIDQSKIQNPKSKILPIRRSRGYAPFPVELPFRLPQVMAVGGELKAAFCLTRENFAFMSQHIGDMENLETLRAFENASEQMKRLFRVEPEIVAGDLHPNYLSSTWARRRFPDFVGVQHHEAHVASVMAENGLGTEDSVIGFAFDGTGFGTDGNIWGGEVFVGGYKQFERAAHLRYFPLAGGDASIRSVYRIALGLMRECGIDWSADLAPAAACTETELAILERQFDRRLNVVDTSSFGRLFDAVASLAGIRQKVSYEAQAAIEFEGVLDENEAESYRFEIAGDEIDWRPVIEAAVSDVRAGIASGRVSAKFHNGIADLIIRLSRKLSLETGIRRIALTGGCFQNSALVCRSVIGLERDGFEVLTHRIVPPNDAGLALGQAVLAGIRISDL